MNEGEQAPTHPRAMEGTCARDRGVGWDFEDVRDHYVHVLFGVDPLRVRYGDPERYLALGRAAVADVMARTFAEASGRAAAAAGALCGRSPTCGTAPGWGIVDHDGSAKSPIGALRDVLAPVALFALDEGVNGVDLWVANDTAEPLEATLDVTQYRHGSVVTAEGSTTVHVPPRSAGTTPSRRGPRPLLRPHRRGPIRSARPRRDGGHAADGRRRHRARSCAARARRRRRRSGRTRTACHGSLDDPEHLAVHVDVDRLARFVTIEAGHRSQSHDHVQAVSPGRRSPSAFATGRTTPQHM